MGLSEEVQTTRGTDARSLTDQRARIKIKNTPVEIHHNYFVGHRRHAMVAQQDFEQVYNNIFDEPREAVVVNYQPDLQHYKVVVYNNTIWNPTGKGIVRYGCDWFPFAENESHFGWDYNNLIDSSNSIYDLWFTGAAINVFNGCTGSRTPYSNPDISNYVNSHNYYYRPDDPAVFAYGTPTVFYTAAEFEAQTVTGAPRVAYTNALDPGNLLYAGTTGADRFVTLGSHTMEGSTTIANGGVGGDHPYLAGVTLPTYVGAAKPDGCNCRTVGSAPGSIPVWPFVLLAALVGMVRSRRRACCRAVSQWMSSRRR